MIAIPIKLNKKDSAIAPLFGKAKWFAFVKDGEVIIEKNEAQGGADVVRWLLEKEVKALVIQRMSQPPYQIIKEEGSIAIFHVGNERTLLAEAVKRYEDESLVIVDDTNSDEIIKVKKK